jgi:hypothetical protein
MYNIQLLSFIRQLLPPHIRKPRVIAMCVVLFTPLSNLFDTFAAYRRTAKLEITATGQVIVLEYNLCRLMSLPTGYIYIAGSVYADFSVLIPNSLNAQQEEQIRQYVEGHKLIGKSFEIIRNI